MFIFHAQAIRLLRVDPVASPEAEAEIAACEAKHGFRLPAPVREWYTHEKADEVLEGFLPRTEVLANCARAASSPAPRLVPFYRQPASEVRFPLDGPDEQLIEPVLKGFTDPEPFARRIEYHAWAKMAHGPEWSRIVFGETPAERSRLRVGPPHLDWFLENFELLPQPNRHKNWQEFRFFGPHGRIKLGTDGDPRTGERLAAGTIIADTPDDAAKLFVFAWPLHPGPIRLEYSDWDASARRRVRYRIRKKVPGVQIQ
ncbi:MAG TPA: hypothetical protein VMZ71_18040 [Gemmataceae bacterium]|nr:hypothetical protein [Gemmataceae bacterium]